MSAGFIVAVLGAAGALLVVQHLLMVRITASVSTVLVALVLDSVNLGRDRFRVHRAWGKRRLPHATLRP